MAAKLLVPAPEILVRKNVVFEEFQSSFGKSVSAASVDKLATGEGDDGSKDAYPISVRFSAGPAAEVLCPGAAESGFLSVSVDGMALALPVSAATALADMFEDEIFPPPFPLSVKVRNLAFKVGGQVLKSESVKMNILS